MVTTKEELERQNIVARENADLDKARIAELLSKKLELHHDIKTPELAISRSKARSRTR